MKNRTDLIADLLPVAWTVRENAYIIGPTKVGCALLADNGITYSGCNVEHRYRCHDVHAEVNAITNMVSNGGKRFSLLVIVAERDRFTPCGSCMDWIMQFANEDCVIAIQASPDGSVTEYKTYDLMPYYPR